MSKRYPLSRATRELNRLLDVAGFSEEGIADASCDLSDVALSPDPARREAVARAVMALESCGEATGSEFAWISRWAACKQVYRIDPEVAASLKGQPLDGSLPAEALMRLPYPIVYVDSPVDTVMSSEVSVSYWPASGFLAYVDRDVVAGLPQLNLVYIHPEEGFMGLRRNVLQLNLGLPTMEEVVGELLEYDEGFYGKETLHEAAEAFARCTAEALNLLLYVVSEEEDAETLYSPPKADRARGVRHGRRTNPETVALLGARVGRRIGEARRARAAASSGGPTGRTVSPHIRRGHWQSFWTGPRKGRTDGRHGDRLVVKWVPPVEVNGTAPGEETVHFGKDPR